MLKRRHLYPGVCACSGGSECLCAGKCISSPSTCAVRALPAFPSREQQSLVAARRASECGSLRDLLAALASAKHSRKPSLGSQACIGEVHAPRGSEYLLFLENLEQSWCLQKSEQMCSPGSKGSQMLQTGNMTSNRYCRTLLQLPGPSTTLADTKWHPSGSECSCAGQLRRDGSVNQRWPLSSFISTDDHIFFLCLLKAMTTISAPKQLPMDRSRELLMTKRNLMFIHNMLACKPTKDDQKKWYLTVFINFLKCLLPCTKIQQKDIKDLFPKQAKQGI
ncbi:uncharacterized protein LOC134414975 [Melospiza melodia melodia]|uniref:uncharacterized protein LOC134414975 n=1 Tax=Melospiza melodia melodia TaxID=1914991 RepID=UPI002FD47FA3